MARVFFFGGKMFSRTILSAVMAAASLWAGPQLTTIQDVLYQANGARFNGFLTISWANFQAADNSPVLMQSTTVTVTNGNLLVQLVPTTTSTPATFYLVTYNSSGRIQSRETWLVPPSTTPLKVSDVRFPPTGSGSSGGTVNSNDITLPINETDVSGLPNDLAVRPVKGPAFAPGRVAVVNSTGAIESATGAASDCVHVDGSAGPCGSADAFVDGENPAGIVDGSNTTFTLSAAPNPVTSLALYRNGLLQKAGQDFSLNGSTVQFVTAATPQPGDTLLASYRTGGDSGGSGGTGGSYPAPQVLCSGTGSGVTGTSLASMGTCAIPAGVLLAGDRVEIRWDVRHTGGASGFSFEVHWGSTIAAHRDATVSETMATGRAEAALTASGAPLSFQTWGTVLTFGTGMVNAADAFGSGLTIDFQGMLAQSGDTLTLSNYSVVRVP
jgi:hypothetical protein